MNSIKHIGNYSELLAAQAFANLLSAECLEVSQYTQQSKYVYEHIYMYKTKPGIDREIVDFREAAVLDAAAEMQSLADILQKAGLRIRESAPETDRPVKKISDRLILKSIRKVVNDALAYQPPVSLCSV